MLILRGVIFFTDLFFPREKKNNFTKTVHLSNGIMSSTLHISLARTKEVKALHLPWFGSGWTVSLRVSSATNLVTCGMIRWLQCYRRLSERYGALCHWDKSLRNKSYVWALCLNSSDSQNTEETVHSGCSIWSKLIPNVICHCNYLGRHIS